MGDASAVVPDLPVIRKSRGLSLREIADRTKIPVFYLEAIERGAFDRLPGGVYTISYVRQYSEAIDFAADVLLQAAHPSQQAEEPPAADAESSLWRRLLRSVTPSPGTRS